MRTPRADRKAAWLAPLLGAAVLGAAAAALGTPAEVRDRFEKAEKTLTKADDSLDGHDAGRVSLLLKRADDEIVDFETASGIAAFVQALDQARDAAGRGEFAAAKTALTRARGPMSALSDYIVPRSSEVALRAALSSASDQKKEEFLADLATLEAAARPRSLQAQVKGARDAVARGRAMMVRNDFKGGKKEVDAALQSLQKLEYLGALSRSRYALMIASELLHDSAYLAARDQTQKGIREVRAALEQAPEPCKEPLTQAQTEATEVWRRINHPIPGDSETLLRASDTVERCRQGV